MLNVSAYEIFKSGKDADATDTAKQRERRRMRRDEILLAQYERNIR